LRERSIGLAASIAVHLVFLAAFFSVATLGRPVPKIRVVDFSLLKESEDSGRMGGSRSGGPVKGEMDQKERHLERSGAAGEIPAQTKEKAVTKTTTSESLQGGVATPKDVALIASDPAGQVAVGGTPGSRGGTSSRSGGRPGREGTSVGQGIDGGVGPGRTIDYSRRGREELAFSFIRESILGNINYPERARRMGWEGKVVLSFAVLENGEIEDVKVVTSSGFTSLDENAKEAVTRTLLRKRLPYRLLVILPIEYRLE
jgi:protein TonB